MEETTCWKCGKHMRLRISTLAFHRRGERASRRTAWQLHFVMSAKPVSMAIRGFSGTQVLVSTITCSQSVGDFYREIMDRLNMPEGTFRLAVGSRDYRIMEHAHAPLASYIWPHLKKVAMSEIVSCDIWFLFHCKNFRRCLHSF